MSVIFFLAFFSLFHFVVPYTPEEWVGFFNKCPPFECGKLGKISIPFTGKSSPAHCGPFVVDNCDKEQQTIQLERPKGRWYEVINISQSNTMFITDKKFQKQLDSKQCQSFNNLSLPSFLYAPLGIKHNITLFKCNPTANLIPYHHFDFSHTECKNFSIYTNISTTTPISLPNCTSVQLPLNINPGHKNIFDLLTASFTLEVYHWWPECYWCQLGGGKCQQNRENKYLCSDKNGEEIPPECFWCRLTGGNCRYNSRKKRVCVYKNGTEILLPGERTKPRGPRGLPWKLALGLGSLVVVVAFPFIFYIRWYKRKYTTSNIIATTNSSHPSPESDLEGESVYFEVPILSYTELEEATSNFDPGKELGNGGFGTVYYGKLQDGREVAVKRLYEHDYRRVKQFMNEIKILARLRHRNLVCLYGCTSLHSRELLLVYEYIPNGTLADHLHGNRAKSGSLTWPIRIRIAIETASALTYLHASDIIHRDVKTDNILLDSNYSVKVADFGLSRLFPNDATHISTAPQGTPGYVDPEYHQCYQLTDKSDVYSFGVVLIELISSIPAVDMTRHRHEINLATLAINKIQKRALDELIDPYLGYQSDEEVKRMIYLVAELAFRCLQQDKEMRPSMDEVLEELQRTESGEYDGMETLEEGHENNQDLKSTELQPLQPDGDEMALLKNVQTAPSPDSVTYKWLSRSSTKSNLSC